MDDGDQPVCFDKFMIRLGIKPGIERECRGAEIHTYPMTKSHKTRKGFRQNRGILLIDRFRRYRRNDEPMIIGNRQFFFTFLVFVS